MKTFRLELKHGKIHLKGNGEPAAGDLLGVPQNMMHREAADTMRKIGLTIRSVSSDKWPTKNKPFGTYYLDKN